MQIYYRTRLMSRTLHSSWYKRLRGCLVLLRYIGSIFFIATDKFLVQSTAVPKGTKEEDVTSNTVGLSFMTLVLMNISFI
nr:hypothetical protein [Tanacetum cinerariifolium]